MKKTLLLSIALFISNHLTMAQKLKQYDKAPEFETKSVQGETINLNKYKGKTVLLAFFRFAGCPVCNFRMHELMENYDKLRAKNIELIAVFESSNQTLASYISDTKIPFPVVSDSSLNLYKKYGTGKSLGKMMSTLFKKKPKQEMKKGEALFNGKKYKQDGSMIRIPSDFIIDENGLIKIAHYGKYIGDHIPLELVLDTSK
jgi:thioredoxin-dependent peroxiredoxin